MRIISFKLAVRKALILSVMLVAAASGKVFAGAGKAGWPILKRSQMSNTRGITSSLGFDSSLAGVFYNPALLGTKSSREAFFISESGFIGDKLGGFMYGHPLSNGMVSGGLIGYDAGQMDLNWIENGTLMTERASAQRDLLGFVSYGRKYGDKLLLGGTVKAASSEIAERKSAQAYAFDVGAMYMPQKNVSVSAAVQNVGMSTKFVEKENPLPTSLYMGGGYTTRIKDYSLLTGLGVSYNVVDETIAPEAGVELRYDFLSMNVGYRFNRDESVLQLGIGVNWKDIEFGYAYMPGTYLDATHRVNVGYRFSGPSSAKASTSSSVKKAAAVKAAAPASRAKRTVKK